MHRRFFIIIFILLHPALLWAANDNTTVRLTIDLAAPSHTFRGWGTSLAWWANGIGDWPDKKLDPIIQLLVNPTDGLGLNVFRYNIGGGDDPTHHHMPDWHEVPGFRASANAAYDWSADANQRRVMLKLIKASPDRPILETFSNSPPYWMTVSGCSGGGIDGAANLKPEFESQFVDYLADVLVFYRDQYHVNFDTLEPFNEPDAKWWVVGKNQEGCHVQEDQQSRVILLARKALDEKHLNQTRISANDANNLDACLSACRSYDEPTLRAVGQINTHSYYGDDRSKLFDFASANHKSLWMSESGPLGIHDESEFGQSFAMARRIVADLNELHPEVWCTWQAVAGRGWGSIHPDPAHRTFQRGKMFYILSHFTRSIRPGDRILNVGSDEVVASYSPARHEIDLIVVNGQAASRIYDFDLSGAKSLGSAGSVIRTTDDDDAVAHAAIPVQHESIQISTPASSVTTVRIPNCAVQN